jgi:hypothetical protein
MLIGDAANQADPLNGGGIHKAMESAFVAASVAMEALERDDCSSATLRLYEERWGALFEVDWRMADLLLAIAINPALKDFCLFLLSQIARLVDRSPQFHEFCSGIFSGVLTRDLCLSPRALYHAFPKDPGAWHALINVPGGAPAGPTHLLAQAFDSLAEATKNAARQPMTTIDWGLEVALRGVRLLDTQLGAPLRQPPAMQTRYLWQSY